MKQFNSTKILKDRSKMFEKYLGKAQEYNDGEITFQDCTLSYTSKNNIMSRNYYLSLQTEVDNIITPSKRSICYLNRLGVWRFKGEDSKLKVLCLKLQNHLEIKKLLKDTDLESVSIISEKGKIRLILNLYGGGFSAIMIPPIKINIGIPKEQFSPSSKLLKTLANEIIKVA